VRWEGDLEAFGRKLVKVLILGNAQIHMRRNFFLKKREKLAKSQRLEMRSAQ